MSKQQYPTIKDFYPYYLGEHRNSTCRILHFIGTFMVIICILITVARLDPRFLIPAPIAGYGFAWVGHFVFEKNRPATFKYPFKSLACDFIMFFELMTGKIPFDEKTVS